MSFYQTLAKVGTKYLGAKRIFKHGFNFSPMYRRSTARITDVDENLLRVKIRLPISYKNRNYVSSIFGGSMFSAVDPIPMVQLINLLGNDYIVWDKSAEIFFKRPARENLVAEFTYTQEEVDEIKQRLETEDEIEIGKITQLTDEKQSKVFCEVHKRLYITTKMYYKAKQRTKKSK